MPDLLIGSTVWLETGRAMIVHEIEEGFATLVSVDGPCSVELMSTDALLLKAKRIDPPDPAADLGHLAEAMTVAHEEIEDDEL